MKRRLSAGFAKNLPQMTNRVTLGFRWSQQIFQMVEPVRVAGAAAVLHVSVTMPPPVARLPLTAVCDAVGGAALVAVPLAMGRWRPLRRSAAAYGQLSETAWALCVEEGTCQLPMQPSLFTLQVLLLLMLLLPQQQKGQQHAGSMAAEHHPQERKP